MNRKGNIVKRWMAGVLAVTMLSSVTGAPVFAAPESTGTSDTVETARVTAWSWTDALGLTQQEDTSSWTLSLSEEQTLSTADDLLALLPVSVEATVARTEPEATATHAPDSTAASDTEATEAQEGAAASTSDAESESSSDSAPASETPTPAAASQPSSSGTPAGEIASTETLTLTWDTSALTFPLAAGDYTVTAALPDGYVLAESAPALAVAVTVAGAATDTTTDTQLPPASNAIQNAPQANQPSLLANDPAYVPGDTVKTVSPVGTTINLFDYWIRAGSDDSVFEDPSGFKGGRFTYSMNDLSRGINKNHILKFSKSGVHTTISGSTEEGNNYTDSAAPYQGIVANTLGENGFPRLNNVPASWAGTADGWEELNSNESLAYLFSTDTSLSSDCRSVYANVKGLLKMEDGYYSFDSDNEYAYFNADTNSFEVNDASRYGFFPFNPADSLDRSPDGNRDILGNHYFGLTMSTRFVQQNDGFSTSGSNQPITYEFSGDDDVWVFIDGVLVGDLGGIHQAASLKIDFSTGRVSINEGKGDGEQITSLKDLFHDADSDSNVHWSATQPNTFANNTYHTLRLFYLERGNNTSNLKLKFNMESTSESSIVNVNQNGEGIGGSKFELLPAQYDSGTNTYTILSDSNVLFKGTTDADGYLSLTDTDGNNLRLDSLKTQLEAINGNAVVLRETSVPKGYRVTGDSVLYFPSGWKQDVLLSSNPWFRGTYASPMVTTTLLQSDKLQAVANSASVTISEDSGVFFAVVLKKESSTTWVPVYGDPINGWQAESDSSWQSIFTAANANPYIFVADNNGPRVTIDNLPGDLSKYYYILSQNKSKEDAANEAEYTIAYYYTSASNLAGANQDNTVRLDTNLADDSVIAREFSVQVYVSNVKNYLIAQAMGPDGQTPLNGVTYSLYTADQVTDNGGTPTLVENAVAYDSATTATMDQASGGLITADGAAVFPSSNKSLDTGAVYYLKETAGPEGYKLSDKLVKVIVNDTGVYADAGTGDDEVTVLRGAGKIVRSMLQFAAPDVINTTLADITITLNTLSTGNEPSTDLTAWSSTQQGISLSYHTTDVPLEYGLTSGTGAPYFVVESGWSRVTVTQNPAQPPEGYGPKQDLGDTDLTNLFSRSTIVRIKNDAQPCSLTLREFIETPIGNDANQEFTVNLTLKNASDTALSGSYPVSVSGTAANDSDILSPLTLDSTGSVSIQLKLNQDVTLEEIPYGTKFTVAEVSNEYYTSAYSVTVMGDTTLDQDHCHGSLTGDGSVTILNTRKTGSVSLTQNVSGPMGSSSDAFSYTLNLYDTAADSSKPAINGTYQATLTPKEGRAQAVSVTFTNGRATEIVPASGTGQAISLKDGDVLAIADLPAGSVCEVTEAENHLGYTTTVGNQAALSGTVTVPAGTSAASITFINTRAEITPTGLREENTPYIAMIGLSGLAALVGAAGWVEMRRRKRREEE